MEKEEGEVVVAEKMLVEGAHKDEEDLLQQGQRVSYRLRILLDLAVFCVAFCHIVKLKSNIVPSCAWFSREVVGRVGNGK